MEGNDDICRRIYTSLSHAHTPNRFYENTALWFSIQPWQAEKSMYLQSTDRHILEKKRKTFNGDSHPKGPRQKAFSVPKLRLLRSASNRTRSTNSLLKLQSHEKVCFAGRLALLYAFYHSKGVIDMDFAGNCAFQVSGPLYFEEHEQMLSP